MSTSHTLRKYQILLDKFLSVITFSRVRELNFCAVLLFSYCTTIITLTFSSSSLSLLSYLCVKCLSRSQANEINQDLFSHAQWAGSHFGILSPIMTIHTYESGSCRFLSIVTNFIFLDNFKFCVFYCSTLMSTNWLRVDLWTTWNFYNGWSAIVIL